MGVLLGAGGIVSGTAGWCSRRCSGYVSSRGGGVPGRRSDLGNGCVVLEKVISWHVLSSVSDGPDEMGHVL